MQETRSKEKDASFNTLLQGKELLLNLRERDLRLDEKSAQLAECKKRIAVLEVQLNQSQGTLTRRCLLESALRLSWLGTSEFDATQAALKLEDHAAKSAPDSPAAKLQECAKEHLKDEEVTQGWGNSWRIAC